MARTTPFYTADSFAKLYAKVLNDIYHKPEFVSTPRGQKVHERLGVELEITNPYSNLFFNEVRSIPFQYLANELVLYFAGKYNVDSLSKELSFGEASAFWKKIANSDGTVNSAYGYLLFKNQAYEQQTQWKWIIDSLKKDENTRQAICHINRPFHQYESNKDFVCTMSYHFFIRDNKLYMHCHRRSQDMYYGMTYDVPWELLLMQCVKKELEDVYPDLELGSYKLFIGSAHIYERDFPVIERMLVKPFSEGMIPRIKENPVLNEHVGLMAHDSRYMYKGHDHFLLWLDNYRREMINVRNSD